MRRHLTAVLCAAVLTGATPVHAQNTEWITRPWMGEVTFLGANALLGGLTAGLLRELRGGAFQDGFTTGLLGGAIAYGGRRVAVEDFTGAGLLGRQLGAVGASITGNASAGEPALSHLQFPVGPLTMHMQRQESGTRVHASVNLFASGWLLAAMLDDRIKFDRGASLSAGAPVFRTPRFKLRSESRDALGTAPGGIIVLSDNVDLHPDHNVLAHERVHVLQHDFAQILWGDPIEKWIGSKLPGVSPVFRYVQPGIAYPALFVALVVPFNMKWGNRPWEIEAEFLEHR